MYVDGMPATVQVPPLRFLSVNPSESEILKVAVGRVTKIIPIVGAAPGEDE